MEKIATINQYYFEEGMTLTKIAEILNVSTSYISRILRKNEKYEIEKERRKKQNLLKRRKVQKRLIYANRKTKIDVEYLNVRKKHCEASKELSKTSTMGKDTLRKWCSSAYIYNPIKNRYEFNSKELLKPADFPKYIKS